MGKMRNANTIFVGKSEGKRPLGRPSRRWKDSIRVYVSEIGCADVDWMLLTQDSHQWRAVVNTVISLQVPYKAENVLASYVTVSFSTKTLTHEVD
jgi:hypothetical protein